MTAIRFVTAGALALMLTACSGDEEPTSTGAGNALLDFVPADTPYVAANLEPLPADVVDAYLLRMRPVLDEMQSQLTAARSGLEQAAAEAGESAVDDPASRLALAVVRELDGKFSRDGLASLGLDILSHKVVYGVGAFPVIRLGLSDSASLRSTIERIIEEAGINAPEQSLQGVSYWRVAPGADAPVGLYVAILTDHLAAGVLPLTAEADVLPAFLGVTMPAGSDARTALAKLNQEHGYTSHGSAILDLHRLADEFLRADRLTAQVLAGAGAYDAAAIAPECAAEIHGILDQAPRMTAGTTEFSASAIAYQYRVETTSTLGGRLAALVAPMPAAMETSGRMLDLSFGLRFGAVRDFLREAAESIVAAPYQCEQLQELNSGASKSLAQLTQPMPPFVNNFRGLRASVDAFAPGMEFAPESSRGVLALHVEQPEMFVGMAQMFLPDLAALSLKPGDAPVALPPGLIPLPGLVAFAAMTGDAIGLSVGASEEDALQDFLGRKPGPEGMFLSASYDTAAYLEYSDQLARGMEDRFEHGLADAGRQHGPGNDRDVAAAVHAIADAARGAVADMADRNWTALTFGPDGLTIDGRMTFKPAVP